MIAAGWAALGIRSASTGTGWLGAGQLAPAAATAAHTFFTFRTTHRATSENPGPQNQMTNEHRLV